jgi:transcriptional regulator with XRE-family HTH domain
MQVANTKKIKINLDAPIGVILKQLRERERYTMADIGRMIYCSRNNICDIECGKCKPSWSKLVDYLHVLGYEPTIRRLKPKRKPRKKKVEGEETKE